MYLRNIKTSSTGSCKCYSTYGVLMSFLTNPRSVCKTHTLKAVMQLLLNITLVFWLFCLTVFSTERKLRASSLTQRRLWTWIHVLGNPALLSKCHTKFVFITFVFSLLTYISLPGFRESWYTRRWTGSECHLTLWYIVVVFSVGL